MKSIVPPLITRVAAAALLATLPHMPVSAQEGKKAFMEGKSDKDAAKEDKSPFGTPKAVPEKETKDAVQVTELGLMRTLVVFDEGIDAALVKIVNQRLSDAHFRVFESPQRVVSYDMEMLKALGQRSQADLVLHASVTAREKKKFGEFSLYEGEATVKILSPTSGELMVTHTDRATGVRKVDEVDAKRSATENVLDAVVKEAATKALEKSDKIIVYEVEISKVPGNLHILRIKDHIAKLQGVYHVRDLSYDPATQIAVLEVLGSPKMLTFLKAHIENMPRMPATK